MEVHLTDKEASSGKRYVSDRSGRAAIGVHVGTSVYKGHAKRRWAREKFAELINRLTDRMTEVTFFLFGSEDEAEATNYIYRNVADKRRIFLLENRNIREVASVIAGLTLFLSNDSGLMHLAAAVGTPVVALLGPTNPNYIRPWGAKHRIVRLNLDCSPCFYYSPRHLRCRMKKEFQCINGISVDMVENEMLDFFGQLSYA
jgi:heptosyltransferase-2